MSIEALAQMDGPTARRILNEVNQTPVPENSKPLVDGFYVVREITYADHMCIYHYTIYNEFGKWVYKLSNMQYPSCCGISILHNFMCDSTRVPINSDAIIAEFIHVTQSHWKPNIQFVAVKCAETVEEYDEDDDEYYDKVVGHNDYYDYEAFLLPLIRVLKPTLISSFINKNSDNHCDVYQAENPFRS